MLLLTKAMCTDGGSSKKGKPHGVRASSGRVVETICFDRQIAVSELPTQLDYGQNTLQEMVEYWLLGNVHKLSTLAVNSWFEREKHGSMLRSARSIWS